MKSIFAGGSGVRDRLLRSDQYGKYVDELTRKFTEVSGEDSDKALDDAIKVGKALEYMINTEGWKIFSQFLDDGIDLAHFLLTNVSEDEKRQLEMNARFVAGLFMQLYGLIENGKRAEKIKQEGVKNG